MLSKNLFAFLVINSVLLTAMVIGILRNHSSTLLLPAVQETQPIRVPSIGHVQVLNGYGGERAADKMADFLRARNFDVKSTGNASTYNYPFTFVISRTKDMTIARQIAKALKTDHLVLIRSEEPAFNVTVVIGPDYGERIK